jgi:RNA polymerase sigma factor (sigma-70 family)
MAKIEESLQGLASARTRGKTEMALLYASVFPETKRLAYLLSRDENAAEDLAQEAFVRAYARVSNLEDLEAIQRYLRRTVLNLVRGRARKKRVEQLYGHLFSQRSNQSHPGSELPDEQLWNAVGRLPLRQRGAIILRHYLDLSEQEAADALDCSVAATKSLTARAMRTLRASLKEDEND